MENSYTVERKIEESVETSIDAYNALVDSDTRIRILKDMLASPDCYIPNDTLSFIVGYKTRAEEKNDE